MSCNLAMSEENPHVLQRNRKNSTKFKQHEPKIDQPSKKKAKLFDWNGQKIAKIHNNQPNSSKMNQKST